MRIDISRLRPGEIIAGAAAVLLLVLMFAVPWYRVRATSIDGWDSLTDLRWLLIVTIIAALALAYFQATRRAPAIPVNLSVIVTVLGLVSSLALIYRVLINVPGSDSVVRCASRGLPGAGERAGDPVRRLRVDAPRRDRPAGRAGRDRDDQAERTGRILESPGCWTVTRFST